MATISAPSRPSTDVSMCHLSFSLHAAALGCSLEFFTFRTRQLCSQVRQKNKSCSGEMMVFHLLNRRLSWGLLVKISQKQLSGRIHSYLDAYLCIDCKCHRWLLIWALLQCYAVAPHMPHALQSLQA